MFNHILVPLDGSLLAERAISHAQQFARVFGGKITLLQVLDPSPYHESQSAVEPLNWQIRKAEAEMYLQGMAARIRESGVAADHALREGCAPENIVDFAHSQDIDLLVMSTHGVSGLSRWNTSSVVTKVMEKIYMPVLLIRAYHAVASTGGVSNSTVSTGSVSNGSVSNGSDLGQSSGFPVATEEYGNVSMVSQSAANPDSASSIERQDSFPPFPYRRILLPIDSSRRAECALPAATTLAKGQQGESATVIMGAVISPPELPIPIPYPEEIHQLIERFMRLNRSAVETYLNEMSQRIEGNCEKRIVENSNVAGALHELADKENIDLVVLCAHGHTGASNYPYGSVARNYIEYGTKTLLIIQDVALAQVRPTAVEMVVEKYGSR